MDLVSFGGGVNSTALVITLVNEGWRGPVVFANTGCEWPETYCYLDYFEEEWLGPHGLALTRLSGLPYQRVKKGMSLIDYCERGQYIPLAGMRWCTVEWKVNAVNRWAAEHDIDIQLIGIAADERNRAKKREGRVYPLVARGITRQRCIDIIEAEGLEPPQKSGCYICPFQRKDQWYELWRRHPDLFERVAAIEESVERTRKGRWKATLDPSGRYTLRDLEHEFDSQMTWLDDAELDALLAYKPCICGI